jgi:2-amino-4-hydroxy-6-hydroxymethyldihydropteridine diphosphokinase
MDAVVGLGANLGDRASTLAAAVAALSEAGEVTAVSALYETEPVGPPQPAYLNAAVRLDFGGTPRELLEVLLAVERRFGRVRRERFGPRTLDLDLLWIAGVQVDEEDLVVPHPRLGERRFALEPLLDVAPEALDPRTGQGISAWLQRLPAGGVVEIAKGDWFRTIANVSRRGLDASES